MGPNTTVTIDYSLSLGGQLISDKESLKFRHGAGEILPKLEEQLAGFSVGQEKYGVICPHDAFGEVDPQLVRVVPVEVFPGHTEVKAGQTYQVGGSKEKATFPSYPKCGGGSCNRRL
jgi:FKBP-type peptidyl-prolyl cis-trans isomerase SlyD